jgi:protein gp37
LGHIAAAKGREVAENSGIAWTTHTFNSWIGCSKVGTGCDHCYAEAYNLRFDGGANWGPGAPRRRTSVANRNKPRRWDREAALKSAPTWVFCQSLADVFDNEVDPEWRRDLWATVSECRNLRWQVVTKRVGNVDKMLPDDWSRENYPHVGIVVTVVTQAEADRDIPRIVRLKNERGIAWVGASIEPQIEEVDLLYPKSVFPEGPRYCCSGTECACMGQPVDVPLIWGLDWLITGGESAQGGFKGRIYDPAWARRVVSDGKWARVPVYVKQMGSNPLGLTLVDRSGADPSEWPEDLRVREMPA